MSNPAERSTLFADLALARRIDAAEASLSAEVTSAVIGRGSVSGAFATPFAGGIAAHTGPGSPMNKIIGVGFDGAPPDAEIARIEAAYFACDASVRAEVSTLADPAFVQQLTRRGYVLNGFENVLARRLAADGTAPALPAGVTIAHATDQRAFMDALLDGFAVPDTGVVSAPGESFERDVAERMLEDMQSARGFVRYVALVNGAVAGAGVMRLCEGVAQLGGAATRPEFRRRGLQTALLETRLDEAAAAGCDIAAVTTEPGSKSQQNVQRAGFALLYSRAVLIKAPPSQGAP